MNKDIARAWVDQLENGGYKQAEGYLSVRGVKEADSFCCLGVLCNMFLDNDEAPIKIEGLLGRGSYNVVEFGDGDTASRTCLPHNFAQYLGVDTSPNYSFFYSLTDGDDVEIDLELASLNDSGFTFKQIADVIKWGEGL